MPHLITLTGPSQAGKSTAINAFMKLNKEGFSPVTIPKFTTREPRKDDQASEVIHSNPLPTDLDLVYQQYSKRYGLKTDTIIHHLERGETPLVVLNDVRIITEVKRVFGDLCKSIFVFRKAPRLEDFMKVAKKRDASDDVEIRLKKAEAIYRIYIENIYLFDHVIVNNEGRRNLKTQVTAISDDCCYSLRNDFV